MNIKVNFADKEYLNGEDHIIINTNAFFNGEKVLAKLRVEEGDIVVTINPEFNPQTLVYKPDELAEKLKKFAHDIISNIDGNVDNTIDGVISSKYKLGLEEIMTGIQKVSRWFDSVDSFQDSVEEKFFLS